MKQERFKVYLSVYLVLHSDDSVLLLQRQNTGYADGCYSLVAGHAEEGETLCQAMIREAKEEAGIDLKVGDIAVAHIMYRQSNRPNIDVFFTCIRWNNNINNCEPEKCSDLRFFPVSQLPSSCLSYICQALDYIEQGIPFSDHSNRK